MNVRLTILVGVLGLCAIPLIRRLGDANDQASVGIAPIPAEAQVVERHVQIAEPAGATPEPIAPQPEPIETQVSEAEPVEIVDFEGKYAGKDMEELIEILRSKTAELNLGWSDEIDRLVASGLGERVSADTAFVPMSTDDTQYGLSYDGSRNAYYRVAMKRESFPAMFQIHDEVEWLKRRTGTSNADLVFQNLDPAMIERGSKD